MAASGRTREFTFWRRLMSVALAIVVGLGSWSAPSRSLADAGAADNYLDQLAQAAGTPRLIWAECGGGFQCATAQVPLDYNRPHDDQIGLSVLKLPASDPSARIGTLFINFGGPGQSGVGRLRDRARWPWLFSEELRARFDLISWDQRGVARSAAVRCFPDDAWQWQFLVPYPPLPMTAAQELPLFAWAKDFADRCRQHAGPIVDHSSSANSARDLELLRRAVGDTALSYHGLSYGSQLGAIYANLFPGRVRAMVLDGSMDFQGNVDGHGNEGATVPLNDRQDVATGTAAAFEQFLRDCAAAGRRCAFSEGDLPVKWATLVDRSRTTPIDVYGHGWTVQEIVVATLAKPTTYPQLADLLQQLFATGTAAPELMDDVTGSDPPPAIGDPAYLGNREEAYNAIQCADSVVPTDLDSYSRAAVSAQWRSPDFGRISVFDALPCAFWQGRDADRYTGVWNRRTAAPLLVLNTRNDPATPLSGAYEGAAELYDARVVVTEGAGHTSMYVASTCTERVKREYLFSGVLPPAGTVCRRDRSPFEETPGS